MPPPEESDAGRQLRLVRQAVLSDTTPCFGWEERPMRAARSRCGGLEPAELKRLAAAFVRGGGAITQRRETDEEWVGRRAFDYWYSVCFDVPGLDDPVFVKIVLVSDDPDFPEARIVGAHLSVG